MIRMEFTINSVRFIKSVKAAVDIINNINAEDPFDLEYIGLESNDNGLFIHIYLKKPKEQITVRVCKSGGYISKKAGKVIVDVIELEDWLTSVPYTEELTVIVTDDFLIVVFDEEYGFYFTIWVFTGYDQRHVPISTEFVEETIVDRQSFLRGIRKVAFAMPKEKLVSSYSCILFESWNDNMRFSAGNGNRFVILDIGAESHEISSNEMREIFPKKHLTNITRIFKDSPQPTITIKLADRKNMRNDRIVIESGSIVLTLLAFEFFTKYPDLSPVVNHNYKYQISTSISDWRHAVEVIATSCESNCKGIHNTKVSANLLNGCFEMQTNKGDQVDRKVDFELGTYVIDPSKDRCYKPWFCCNSWGLREMIKKRHKDGVVIVNFDDQVQFNYIPKELKDIKTVLIKYPEKKYTDSTKETFSMFFSVSNIW